MKEKLKILIANDDGIRSEGIAKLARAAASFGTVWVAAPEHQCSGMSVRLTISEKSQMAVYRYDFPVPVEAAWSVDGTPADCVKVALNALLLFRPDIVLSGINDGLNAGLDVAYSGTIGAATEAAMHGVPAIAFSMRDGKSFDVTDHYLCSVLGELLEKPLGRGEIWNVNFPTCPLCDCVITKFRKMVDLLEKILQPDWSFFPKVVSPLIDTIKMSILGTVIGCVLALPVAILSSSNINKSIPVVWLIRFLLGLIRTLPTLIIALVCALIFSLGTFSGTIAIAIFTFGIVAKMLFESIETIDMGPFEAMEALGANKFQAFWSACVPQILPVYLSHCLYCFEMNVRASAILGYVGAGGLGITINERIGWRDYNSLGTVLLSLFVVVVIIDFFSEYLRKKLS